MLRAVRLRGWGEGVEEEVKWLPNLSLNKKTQGWDPEKFQERQLTKGRRSPACRAPSPAAASPPRPPSPPGRGDLTAPEFAESADGFCSLHEIRPRGKTPGRASLFVF